MVSSVEARQSRILGADGRGASYRNVQATALGDWMKEADSQSLVYSVAGKDRSAVLLGGQRPDGAIWFHPQAGGFTTSTYYADTIPKAVQIFNARNRVEPFFGKDWQRALKDEKLYRTYAGADDAPGENMISRDEDSPVFPHRLTGRPASDGFGAFMAFPWLDELTVKLARHLIESTRIGLDDHPDLLAVSLSAFDVLGHAFGPNSQEAMDAAIRVDRELGAFVQFVEQRFGRGRVLLVLTSDHGVMPLAEVCRSKGLPAARVSAEVKAFRTRLFDELEKKYESAARLFLFRGQENIHFDHEELARRRIDPQDLYEEVRLLASTETWIAHILDREELLHPRDLNPVGQQMLHSFHPEKGADLYLIPKPYLITQGAPRGANHGSPYDYDARVPLLFYGWQAAPKTANRPVRTVDLAPTLARILGVATPDGLDGTALEELISEN